MLNSAGRWLLRVVDYRTYAIIILIVSAFFVFWRRWHYKSWPSHDDYLNLVIGLLGIAGGLPVGVVFLMTKPPATNMLSGTMLASIGLLVPIVCIAFAWPRLRALFLPYEAPRPLEAQRAKLGDVGGDSRSAKRV